MSDNKTAVVTGASKGIGAGLVQAFLDCGYNVVATARSATRSLTPSANLALVDGDIAEQETAEKTVNAALSQFGSIDVLIVNAGIFFTKRFTDFTIDDFNSLIATNLLGFFFIAQLAVRQMMEQKSGVVISMSASLADQPIRGVNASVPMITKGGLNAIIRNLAIEYADKGIRFNAVAPGVVDTPMHASDPKVALKELQPMRSIAEVQDVVDAVLYLCTAKQVTGEILHVDGGVHAGRW